MAIITENILDIIEDGGEIGMQEDLSAFSSPMNPEIEDFIHNKAIDFAKRKLSITYLLTDVDDGQLLGYFTLAHKAIDIDGSCLSGSDKRDSPDMRAMIRILAHTQRQLSSSLNSERITQLTVGNASLEKK